MKSSIIILLSILTLLTFSEVKASTPLNATDAFDKMKSLVGVWQKEGIEKPNLIVSFELIANSSVLVETWLHKGKKHSLTIYHLNKESLMATHYCPQGNQPRLKLSERSTLSNLNFNFLDITNLVDLADSHQHSLAFEFLTNKNKIRRKESYLSKSGEELSELILVRGK